METADAPTPWQQLAAQARELADWADTRASAPAGVLVPAERGDEFASAAERVAELADLVIACRTEVWQRLREEGRTQAEIGRAWGVSQQRVSRLLIS